MVIKNSKTADATDVWKNIITFLEGAIQATTICEDQTLTDQSYDYAQVDIFSDSTGYNNTIDTGNSTATFDTDHYKSTSGSTYVYTNTHAIGSNVDSILVTGKTTTPGNSTITIDVSTDGGSTWDVTDESLNEVIELDGDSDDVVVRFKLTEDSGNDPLLYNYGYQVWT